MIKIKSLKPIYSVLATTAIATTFFPHMSQASPEPVQTGQTPSLSLPKPAQPSQIYAVEQNEILLKAVKEGDLIAVKVALSRQADPNTTDEKADTAFKGIPVLQIAASNNSLEITKALIDYGANVNGNARYTYIGGTPLSTAAGKGHIKIVQLLISKGVKIDTSSDGGYTALDSAIGINHADIVKLLLESGMNPNYYVEGYTPLYEAASMGYANIVNILIQHGADVNFGNSFGKPLAIAIQKSHFEVIDILKQAGAK